MNKIYFSFILFFMSLNVFATNVDITATPSSGTYHAPIYITLTPTERGAKTFYSFKPDGYPNDAFLYTGPILLKHSSPFIYFSFLSTSNESKIKQNNYIIEYSSNIHFEAESISGSGKVGVVLINSGSENVNIGFWQVQSESDTVTLPEGTMIASGATYNISLNYPGQSSIVLRSPDDDERDILVPKDTPAPSVGIPLKKKTITTKIVPRKIISIGETPQEVKYTDPLVPSEIGLGWSEEVVTPIEKGSSLPTPSTSTKAPNVDINQIVKVSATESGQKSMNPLYLVALWALSFGAGTVQWYMRRRNK